MLAILKILLMIAAVFAEVGVSINGGSAILAIDVLFIAQALFDRPSSRFDSRTEEFRSGGVDIANCLGVFTLNAPLRFKLEPSQTADDIRDRVVGRTGWCWLV